MFFFFFSFFFFFVQRVFNRKWKENCCQTYIMARRRKFLAYIKEVLIHIKIIKKKKQEAHIEKNEKLQQQLQKCIFKQKFSTFLYIYIHTYIYIVIFIKNIAYYNEILFMKNKEYFFISAITVFMMNISIIVLYTRIYQCHMTT